MSDETIVVRIPVLLTVEVEAYHFTSKTEARKWLDECFHPRRANDPLERVRIIDGEWSKTTPVGTIRTAVALDQAELGR